MPEGYAVDVTVVGAGVIGLTTAVELQAAGYTVQVVAAARGEATTSFVAGALWFPFRADPPDRVNGWARRSRERLQALASAKPEAGVDVLTVYEAADGAETPWWAPSAPDLTLVPDVPARLRGLALPGAPGGARGVSRVAGRATATARPKAQGDVP